MKTRYLNELTVEELKVNLHELEEELFNLRFRRGIQELGNPVKIRELRRDIARVKTAIREFDLGIRGRSEPAP